MSSSLAESVNIGRSEAPNLASPFDLGWTAALLDGEGSIFVHPYRTDHGAVQFSARVSVTNTALALLEKVRSIWGGRIQPRPSRGKNWKPTYFWVADANIMRRMLPQVVSHLVVKRKQAFLAMLMLGSLALAYGQHGRGRGHKLPREVQAYRHTIWQLVKRLNKRGPIEHKTSPTKPNPQLPPALAGH